MPPVPAWCEGAQGGAACVAAMIAEDDPTSIMWRPVWTRFDESYCTDKGTTSWQVSCDAPDAVRVMDSLGLIMRSPGEPDQIVGRERPPWRNGAVE